ncbi:uncharacterized [Lates japonicus]
MFWVSCEEARKETDIEKKSWPSMSTKPINWCQRIRLSLSLYHCVLKTRGPPGRMHNWMAQGYGNTPNPHLDSALYKWPQWTECPSDARKIMQPCLK